MNISMYTVIGFIFYNGTGNLEDSVTYRLSELFQKPVKEPSIELVVTCLSIFNMRKKIVTILVTIQATVPATVPDMTLVMVPAMKVVTHQV